MIKSKSRNEKRKLSNFRFAEKRKKLDKQINKQKLNINELALRNFQENRDIFSNLFISQRISSFKLPFRRIIAVGKGTNKTK